MINIKEPQTGDRIIIRTAHWFCEGIVTYAKNWGKDGWEIWLRVDTATHGFNMGQVTWIECLEKGTFEVVT